VRQLCIELAGCLPEASEEKRWLVEGLWAQGEVGVIGGQPKSFKSFLALDLAVSVASGTPCLGRHRVPTPGRVLLYAAEDLEDEVRLRLEKLCDRSGVDFATLDLHVIRETSLRLDVEEDCLALEDAVARLEPVLFILDPFVRCHRIDENVSAQVVPLLAFLRELQRRYGCAVAVVHHAKKGTGSIRPGQALRGSSEFHSWGGSNLYLRLAGEGEVTLNVEQRSAPSIEGLRLRLDSTGDRLGLVYVDESHEHRPPPNASSRHPETRIFETLAGEQEPVPFAKLRDLVKMRTQTFTRALSALVADHRVTKTDDGYEIFI